MLFAPILSVTNLLTDHQTARLTTGMVVQCLRQCRAQMHLRHGCRYWIGYTMQSARVTSMVGENLGAYNSSTVPYLHFVDYDSSSTMSCAMAHGRSSYYQYRWW